MEFLKRFIAGDEGADAAEYALVIGLVALAIVAGAFALGGQLGNAFNSAANCLGKETGSGAGATC